MELLLQQLTNGLALGSIYAIFGIGFGLVFSTLGIMNIAHGAFATMGAIAALWVAQEFSTPFIPTLLIGAIAGGLIGALVDQLAFQPLRKRGGNLIPAIITSIGALTILEAVARMSTGARPYRYPDTMFDQSVFTFGFLTVPWIQIASVVVMVILVVALDLLLRKTRLGSAMRAVGYDGASAAIGGVNPRQVIIVTAFAAGALAGIAGVLSGAMSGNVSFLLGEALLLKGFAAVVIGGFGDVRGTAIGGILIGVVEMLSSQYLGGTWRDAITFGLLFVFLLYRPSGIFGRQTLATRA